MSRQIKPKEQSLIEVVKKLEKRIKDLESQRPIINVYSQPYQVPNYQPQYPPKW